MNERKNPKSVLTECPVCDGELKVAKLHCHSCKTTIKGEFTLSKLNYLDNEKLYFIEVFVKNRGNIKAIEKELNSSYPTVKKMLNEVIVELGYSINDQDDPFLEGEKREEKSHKKDFKKNILEKIEQGQLKVEDAIEMLKKKKG